MPVTGKNEEEPKQKSPEITTAVQRHKINRLSLLNDRIEGREIILGDLEKAKKKQAFVFVHGLASHQDSHFPILQRCITSEDRLLYTYDMRGCGGSLGYGVNTQKNAVDFLKIIEELSRMRPHLKRTGMKPICFSYGTHVVYEAYYRYYKRMQRIRSMNGARPAFESYLDVPLSPPVSIFAPLDLKTGAGPMLKPLRVYQWLDSFPGIDAWPAMSSRLFGTLDRITFSRAMRIAAALNRIKPYPDQMISSFIEARKEKLKKRGEKDDSEILGWFEAMPVRKGNVRFIARTIFKGTSIDEKVERAKSVGAEPGLFIVGIKDNIAGIVDEKGVSRDEVRDRFRKLGRVLEIGMPHHPDENMQRELFKTITEEIIEEEIMLVPLPIRVGVRAAMLARKGLDAAINFVVENTKKEE